MREHADYNPDMPFYVDELLYWIAVAENVIERFEDAPAHDLRAFAAYVLLPIRRHG